MKKTIYLCLLAGAISSCKSELSEIDKVTISAALMNHNMIMGGIKLKEDLERIDYNGKIEILLMKIGYNQHDRDSMMKRMKDSTTEANKMFYHGSPYVGGYDLYSDTVVTEEEYMKFCKDNNFKPLETLYMLRKDKESK